MFKKPEKKVMVPVGPVKAGHPTGEFLEILKGADTFLGDEKYQPCLNAIYAGLGIPWPPCPNCSNNDWCHEGSTRTCRNCGRRI